MEEKTIVLLLSADAPGVERIHKFPHLAKHLVVHIIRGHEFCKSIGEVRCSEVLPLDDRRCTVQRIGDVWRTNRSFILAPTN